MMGDEEKKDPPPPSLSKPSPVPPPPSLSKAEPAPEMPPASSSPGPPVLQKPVKVNTPEEAADEELAHEAPAPLNTRLLAGLIDGLVGGGLGFVVSLILPSQLATLVWIAYMMVRDCLPFLKGQSVGKTAMKLKVVKKDGSDLVNDWQTGVIRNILMVIPIFGPLIEAVVLISRDGKPEKGMRLGDDFVKTRVIVWRPEEELPEEP
ncbi:RDD family protein [Haloferula chungangensis]|uniref:RDD family protein n=1 Tax=Haloferula chungangensis TaxID=1048331 RepID=A0ABW2L5V4_9BACT